MKRERFIKITMLRLKINEKRKEINYIFYLPNVALDFTRTARKCG